MSLSEFPVELLDLCLEDVGTSELLAIRATCKRLRDVVSWSGRMRAVMTRTAGLTEIKVGKMFRVVIEEDLITNHASKGLDFILENVRELWLGVLPLVSYSYHYRGAHMLLDSILHLFEHELPRSRLEQVYIWPIVALDVYSAGRLMERMNASLLDFVVPDVRFHKIYDDKNEHRVRLGDKFLNASLELSSHKASLFRHIDLSLATRLTHLDIIGKTTPARHRRPNWALGGLPGLWKQCRVLKSVQFSADESEADFQIPYRYLTPAILPQSLERLILSKCSIKFEHETKVSFADNVSIVSMVCGSSMFLEPIIGSLNNLTLKTLGDEALDIMSTRAFAQSPLRRLSLHVNTFSNVRLSQLSNLPCLEDLQITMNEKPTRNKRIALRKFLAQNPSLNVTLSIHKFGRITSWNMRSYLHV